MRICHSNLRICYTLRKKVEPNWCIRGAVLENGSSLQRGSIFSLTNGQTRSLKGTEMVTPLLVREGEGPFSMEKRLHFKKRGAKIVPQRGLFFGQKRCLWGAVLAPPFFLSVGIVCRIGGMCIYRTSIYSPGELQPKSVVVMASQVLPARPPGPAQSIEPGLVTVIQLPSAYFIQQSLLSHRNGLK